jgi:hypothetical protein
MMIGLLGEQRDARHESESLAEIGESEAACDRQTIIAQFPVWQPCQISIALSISEFGDGHLFLLGCRSLAVLHVSPIATAHARLPPLRN